MDPEIPVIQIARCWLEAEIPVIQMASCWVEKHKDGYGQTGFNSVTDPFGRDVVGKECNQAVEFQTELFYRYLQQPFYLEVVLEVFEILGGERCLCRFRSDLL